MVHTTVEGTFRQTNLTSESPEYLGKREELRLAEIELMRQRERVAELRRHLPQGAAIQDYRFEEGPRDLNAGDTPVRAARLSELFSAPNRSLVVYHFMLGNGRAKLAPCAPPGWTARTASRITSLRISISLSWPRLMFRRCAHMLALAAGTSCASSAPATAHSNTTSAAKIAGGAGLDGFRVHPRHRRHPSPLLQRASLDGPRRQRAWHRPARSDLARHGPDATRPRQLVRQPGLRH